MNLGLGVDIEEQAVFAGWADLGPVLIRDVRLRARGARRLSRAERRP